MSQARGSAAGSLVAYLLGLTVIDPLHYNLLFERFLSRERKSMPDIDLDFADDRRDEVMKLIDEEPSISILVLGASTGPKGPGPLVQALTSKYVGKLRVPVTIVPGQLTNDDIDHIA